MDYYNEKLIENIKKDGNKKFYNRPKNTMFKFMILILSCLIFIILAINIYMKANYFDEIVKYSKINKVDPAMITSIIYLESGFDENYISEDNRYGLMQISEDMFLTALEYSENKTLIINGVYITENDFELVIDKDINIYIGTWYYSYLTNTFNNDERNILCAYEAGIDTVYSWLNNFDYSFNGEDIYIIPDKDTAHFLHMINTVYATFDILLKYRF